MTPPADCHDLPLSGETIFRAMVAINSAHTDHLRRHGPDAPYVPGYLAAVGERALREAERESGEAASDVR